MESNNGNFLVEYFENQEHRLIHKWMNYFEVYDRHFHKFCGQPMSLLEFGVSHGGSLQMWKHYFGKDAKIYGVDIDPRCASLGEENIVIIQGDQESRQSLKDITATLPKLDIIIDDGGHTFTQQINTFEECYERLNNGGIYLCEDTHTSFAPGWGGGHGNPATFVEYSKRLIDKLYAWHAQDPRLPVDQFTRNTFGLHFYDGVVVIEKRPINPPTARMKGVPSFPLSPGEQYVYEKG